MADLSDVTAYLVNVAMGAVYPSGSSQPSVAAMDCRVFEGWPLPDQLDLDITGKMKDPLTGAVIARPRGAVANVSVFPMQGTGVTIPQILDRTEVITPAVHGMAISVAGNVVTVAGQPTTGEFITLICDGNITFSNGGANTAALLATLLAAVQVNYPSASATATTITVPVGHSLVVRQGAVGLLGKVTHRQRHSVMVTVWAPTQVVRKVLAKAIDVAVKKTVKITLPDTSQAIVAYSRTSVSDEQQSAAIYRRDLIYDVDYATLETFNGTEITSVNDTITAVTNNSSASVTALI